MPPTHEPPPSTPPTEPTDPQLEALSTQARDPDRVMLREVATSMREQHPISHPRHSMWFELAKVLEQEAVLPPQRRIVGIVRVARAYRAAIPRPDVDESTTP